jgi:DNA-binding MarR family transcriptional regulator
MDQLGDDHAPPEPTRQRGPATSGPALSGPATSGPTATEETDGRRPWANSERTMAIIDRLRDFTTAMEHYVEVRGAAHGMHRTDLHALGHIMNAARRDEDLTPGRLAAALSLSSPATSALLARLEEAGHVRRTHNTSDRRRVSVEMTDEARAVGRAVFAPLGSSIAQVVESLDADEQDTVLRFLDGIVEATSRTTDVPAPAPAPAGAGRAASKER